MAFSSAIEFLNQLIICYDIVFISENEYLKLRGDLESITNKLNALRTYQVNKSPEANK